MGVVKEMLANMVNSIVLLLDAGDEITLKSTVNEDDAFNVFRDGELYYCIAWDTGEYIDYADDETIGDKIEYMLINDFKPEKSYPRQTAYNLECMRTKHAKKRMYECDLYTALENVNEKELIKTIEKLMNDKEQVRLFFEKETFTTTINTKVIVSIYNHGYRGARVQIFEYENVTDEIIDNFTCPAHYSEMFWDVIYQLIAEMGLISIYAI